MTARPMIFFGSAVVLALLTSLLAYVFLNQQQGKNATRPTITIAVASEAVPIWTKLTPSMARLETFPAETVTDDHMRDLTALQDRILKEDLKKGDPILKSKLVMSFASLTDPRKRAMAVKVDEVIGVAGFIKPGDRVDVMVTFQPTADAQSVTAKVILEKIPVLAAGTQMLRTGKDEDAKAVQVITLEVDLVEAEKLALASTQGKLRLALRNPNDVEEVATDGARLQSLLASYQKQKPAPERRAAAPRDDSIKVEVIRGGTQKEVKF